MLTGHPHGLFFRDTRFLSELRVRVNGEWPEPLAARSLDPFSASFVLRANPQPGRADSHLVVFRSRYIGRGMREDVTVHNYGEEAAFCGIEVDVDCDFADLFEVKEGRVEKSGELSVERDRARRTCSATSEGRSAARARIDFSQPTQRRRSRRELRGHRSADATSGRSASR